MDNCALGGPKFPTPKFPIFAALGYDQSNTIHRTTLGALHKSTMAIPSSSPDTQPNAHYSGAFERAAELLTAPSALVHMELEEARVVVGYMTPRWIPAETTFIREGDAADEGFMALLLEGEVVVESITVSRTEPLTIKVLGPGSLVGEVGLVDKEPRSASCTASTDVLCAILSREALGALMVAEPTISAKLLLAISARLAERLRDNARKLRLYAKLAKAMHQELERFTIDALRAQKP